MIQTEITGAASQAMSGVGSAISGMALTIGNALPTIVGALIILLIGWIIARIIRAVILKVLKAINFDGLVAKTGANEYIAKSGLKGGLSNVFAKIVYWMIMLTVLNMFFSKLGIDAVTELFGKVVAYMPNIIVGIILLLIGLWLSDLVKNLVTAPLAANGVKKASMFGNIAKGLVLFIVGSMVLQQVGIGTGIVDNITSSFFNALGYGAAAAFAIAFGMGGKDWAAGVINKNLNK